MLASKYMKMVSDCRRLVRRGIAQKDRAQMSSRDLIRLEALLDAFRTPRPVHLPELILAMLTCFVFDTTTLVNFMTLLRQAVDTVATPEAPLALQDAEAISHLVRAVPCICFIFRNCSHYYLVKIYRGSGQRIARPLGTGRCPAWFRHRV